MIVEVSARGVALTEPSDFTRFHVIALTDEATVATVLEGAGAGRLAGEGHAAIDIGFLTDVWTALAAEQERSSFEAMLAHAASMGWTTDADEVLGHVLWSATDEG